MTRRTHSHWTDTVRTWLDTVNENDRVPAPLRSTLSTVTREALRYERSTERTLRRLFGDARSWGRARSNQTERLFDGRIRTAYARLGLATRDDLNRLEGKVRALTRTLTSRDSAQDTTQS